MSNSIPARPHATREMIRVAAQKLAAQMECSEDDLADHYYHRLDGYEFARELEQQAGWSIERSMIDDLDQMESFVDEQVREAEKRWFVDNDIQPPLPVGTRVFCSVRKRFGVIDEIYKHGPAMYAVAPEEPDEREQAHNSRWIIKFECVGSAQSELSREA